MKLFNKNQFKIFLLLAIAVTLPFAILTLLGQIKNESGLIMIFPMLAGMPWILIYLALPFDIPGLTSSSNTSVSGDNILNFWQLFLFMLPVYINLYLLTCAIFKFKPKATQTNQLK